MTDVVNNTGSDGYFMEAIEEFNYPAIEESYAEPPHITAAKAKNARNGIFAMFFHALEQANYPQLSSSESLTSMASSTRPSEQELQQAATNAGVFQIFQAFQTIAMVRQMSSCAFLEQQDQQKDEDSKSSLIALPKSVEMFLSIYNEFMQNYPNVEGTASQEGN